MKLPRDALAENPPEEPNEDAEIAPGAVPIGLTRIVDAMYADINNPAIATDDYFANRTIFTTINAMVHRINDAVSARLDGDAREYRSIDSVQDDKVSNFFEQEVLNSVSVNGIPPHKLTLKVGAPIMLMRNLNPDIGICTGHDYGLLSSNHTSFTRR
ncbi:hypothetical protein PF008_g24368 [Phytophthora fragariae]|uniref:DNA helicase Pif1-like 2B domain-containing protein n=1 Tax=Phytophthora fragariae TaxID=53985 RepID=A0A6G0QNR0_9STRA|nr:hypothetical protein PF008_g24368 [Phytophthora fragariae]